MEKYNGNQKGFIYVSFDDANHKEVFEKYLEPLAKDGVSFWWADGFDSKEEKNLAKSSAVLAFLTKDYVKDSKLRDTITAAVRSNKPLLCVYLEDVELDAALSMQTEAQQALFVNKFKDDEEFVEELKKASIFDNVQASMQQKGVQKKRGLIVAAAVLVAAVLLFVLVIKPLMAPKANEETMAALGLQGMSKEELESIKKLRVVGNDVLDQEAEAFYDGDRATVYYYPLDFEGHENGAVKETPAGTISDLSGIEQLTKLGILQIEGQQIEDASPIFENTNIYNLSLNCNPVSSLEGLEKLERLETLYIEYTDVTELPDGAHPKRVYARESKLAKVPDFGGKQDVEFIADGAKIKDFSNLDTAGSYGSLFIEAHGVPYGEITDKLKGKGVGELLIYGLDINSLKDLSEIHVKKKLILIDSGINSLDGAEDLEVSELNLAGCSGLKDLSKVNDMPNLERLVIDQSLAGLAGTVDDRIEVVIEEYGDDNNALAASVERYLRENWDGESEVSYDGMDYRVYVKISDESGSIDEGRLNDLSEGIKKVIKDAGMEDNWRLTISYVKKGDVGEETVREIKE